MTNRQKTNRRPPGRPPERGEGETRELLLTAATQSFGEQGAAASTFSLIARRAGLTPAVVHYYFSDRDALLDAVVNERIAPLIASVWDPVGPGDSVETIVRGVVERLLAGIERNPWIPSTWMREILNEGGLLRARVLLRLPLDKVRMVGAAMVRGQREGAIHTDLDPILIVFSMLGLVMLHMATAGLVVNILHRDMPDHAVLGRHITGVLLHGLECHPAATPRRKGTARR
ncbi:MAG: TetR/AcrR family transcriptional regulator [Terracidiphilus sp.]